ncbi:hypothetical protein D0864_07444 [Hortaea werneckii]|uniref:NADH dehydrogenase [ubiquinone] 1 beta subcomplex subunit 11, mitochondrial n=3 Tax=Hortaea werneckii TaxID=91943 RepID=A0A3M7EGK0_HORWE|nr:hypothetical protein D0862_13878 [Hortaea werneckii]RMY84874.1 hypothetical protein D0864_07444 [Hortaea werneckii]
MSAGQEFVSLPEPATPAPDAKLRQPNLSGMLGRRQHSPPSRRQARQRPTPHLYSYSDRTADMSLARTARLISSPRARLQLIPNLTAARAPQHRTLTSTSALRAGDHAHEDHYEPPNGWLFGVKPGEKYENEGWENIWYYGFFGSLVFGLVGYCYKPDTSIQTWALEEARRRLEAEGILEDSEKAR